MKKLLLVSIILLLNISAFAQLRRGNRPNMKLDPGAGYITINEINAGFGLGGTVSPYSSNFFGLTSVHGYQVDDIFMIGGGSGFLIYNEGVLIPLFADIRMRFMPNLITPYISAAGGMLLNPSDFMGDSRLFINPSAGVRYTITRRRTMGITASLGFWMQQGSKSSRASFINLKVGAVYKFPY